MPLAGYPALQYLQSGRIRKLDAEEIAEIEFRFEALKPYLKPNPPRFDAAKE